MGRWGGGTPESEQGGGGEQLFGYADMVDQLCVVYPIVHLQEVETNFQKNRAVKDAIVCDVVILDGNQFGQGEVHRGALIFAGRFIGLSKRHCGAGAPGCDIPPLLGTVTQDARQGPSSRTWIPLHENQQAVQLADAWAESTGAGFIPSTPEQVERERAMRQQQAQQHRSDQMGWPQDAQPRQGGQRQQGGWSGGQQRQPQGGNWSQQGQQQRPSGPPQGGWNSGQQGQNRPVSGPPQGGWSNGGGGQQRPVSGPPQQNQPQPPSWAQQSAAPAQAPQQNVPQGGGAQSTFDQMAQREGFEAQGTGYAGAPQDDPWANGQPPY